MELEAESPAADEEQTALRVEPWKSVEEWAGYDSIQSPMVAFRAASRGHMDLLSCWATAPPALMLMDAGKAPTRTIVATALAAPVLHVLHDQRANG